jgi:hypothetical protein
MDSSPIWGSKHVCTHPGPEKSLYRTLILIFFTGSSSEACGMFIEKGFTIPLTTYVTSICTAANIL